MILESWKRYCRSGKRVGAVSFENGKYHLIAEDSYEEYYFLFGELCDAE